MPNRLVIVSNRLPFTLCKERGKVHFSASSGGLVTGISAYVDDLKSSSFAERTHLWVGWPGMEIEKDVLNKMKKKMRDDYNSHPVNVSEKDMESFYYGFCNKTIWPLFHSFPVYTLYNERFWESYKRINLKFCEALFEVLRPDDTVWIHDYHLMLLPKLVRDRFPDNPIGFFQHIPFPPFEIFRLLPKIWRTEILEGMLGADLVGFHTNDYTQEFLRCVLRILGYEHDMGKIFLESRIVKSDTFPMGIHYAKFAGAARDEKVLREIKSIRKMLRNIRTILSVDRLDYTKGILNRLSGFELFLERYPEWRNRVSLLLVVVPSRIGVESYEKMKNRIDESVGKINGRFGTIRWTPIHYQFRNIPFTPLVALYGACDVALVTPLRDGMNLVAKEYVASRVDGTGVLILSEMAGSARELGESVILNPNHKEEIADSIRLALEMPLDEQRARNKAMQKRLSDYDVIRWADDFFHEINDVIEENKRYRTRWLSDSEKRHIVQAFRETRSKIIFLDYDGTLVPFSTDPQNAKPDPALLQSIQNLAEGGNAKVVLTSGRDRDTLERWFGRCDVVLVAEHGIWIKDKDDPWRLFKPMETGWKSKLLPVLQRHKDRLSGSFVEEKEYSLAWHYRKSDPELAALRARELFDDLVSLTAKSNLQVLQGKKVIEVRDSGINKGTSAALILSQNVYDFVFAVGDDWTDEDLFRVLPKESFTIRVGNVMSCARWNLGDFRDVRRLLEEMTSGLTRADKSSIP